MLGLGSCGGLGVDRHLGQRYRVRLLQPRRVRLEHRDGGGDLQFTRDEEAAQHGGVVQVQPGDARAPSAEFSLQLDLRCCQGFLQLWAARIRARVQDGVDLLRGERGHPAARRASEFRAPTRSGARQPGAKTRDAFGNNRVEKNTACGARSNHYP